MCSSGANVSKHSADNVGLGASPLVHIGLVVLADREAVDVDVALVRPRPSPQLQRIVAKGGSAGRVENWNFRARCARARASRLLLLLLGSHHVRNGGSHLDSAWSGRRADR